MPMLIRMSAASCARFSRGSLETSRKRQIRKDVPPYGLLSKTRCARDLEPTGRHRGAMLHYLNYRGIEGMASQSQDLDIATGLVPRRAAASSGIRHGSGQWLDWRTAERYYDRAGGDPDAARVMAANDGWRF